MHNYVRRFTITPILALILLFAGPVFAGNKTRHKWSVQKPFEQYAFIENKGQFPQYILDQVKSPILYSTKKGRVHIYFTANSVVYGYDSITYIKNNDRDGGEEKGVDGLGKIKLYKFDVQWEGANPNPDVEVENPLGSYFTYPNLQDNTGKSGIKANAWSKLVYHNLYKGIDVEFYYPQGRGGIEYNVIVHPGADVSVFKMKYNGADVKLKENNIEITSPFGIFTDHAPSAVSNASAVTSAFKTKDNTVSIELGSYDNKQFVTIDPWTTSTAFAGFNEAYDLDYDNNGNVYIAGGGNAVEYQIQKYNSTGALQWTYTNTFTYSYVGDYLYSDLAVDHRKGSSYFAEGGNLTSGSQIVKVNTNGAQYGLYAGSTTIMEMWRLAFDYCNNQIVIAGGNPSIAPLPAQAGVIDTGLTTLSAVNVLGAVDYYHDMSLLCVDNVGNAYMASSSTVSGTFNNTMMRLPLPTLTPTIYQVYDGHSFAEISSVSYYPPLGGGIYSCNGLNGMAANSTMLLTYDGKELKKWRPGSGNYVDSIAVSSTYYNWGGIDLDCRGNIYVANDSTVDIYDSTLAPTGTPISFKNTIYDLRINGEGSIYVCGNGFVAADTMFGSHMLDISVTQPTSCKLCNGSITAAACGVPPISYLWSTGATTQTISGLCTGNYTVVAKDGSCLPRIDSSIVTLGVAGYFATTTQVNPTCIKKGSATVNVSGGAPPYKYLWSTGDTNAHDTGLIAGTYTVTIKDTNGCLLSVYVTLQLPQLPNIKIAPPIDSICPGGSISLVASGGATYTWAPASSLNCTTCVTVTASPTTATTYTVTGIDTGGCVNTSTTIINIAKLPTITVFPPKDSICPGGTAILNAGGGVSYIWTPASSISCSTCALTNASPTGNTTYTVTGKNALGCSNTATVNVKILPVPLVIVNPSKDSICKGFTATLTASGGASYTWTPAAGLSSTNSATVTANPASTTTYTVTASNGVCTHDTTIVVKVLASPVITLTVPVKICDGKDTTLTATGGGTYLWNTLQTTSSITVNPTSNTGYTVVVTGADGCKDSASTVVDVDVPTMRVCCDTTIVKGTSVQLNDTGNVVAYVWTPGGGLNCFTCPDPVASPTVNTTYTVVGTDANGCSIIETVTIDMKCFDFNVPNVFTPNGDNQDDEFVITFPTINTYSINIFDRWGLLMYKSTDPTQSWNGKTMKGAEAPDGVYYYIINATCGDNNYDKKGYVQIIR